MNDKATKIRMDKEEEEDRKEMNDEQEERTE